jgi:IS30 family transposase
MKKHFAHAVSSLTLDNDIAFTHHLTVANALNTSIYFCEPYKSWQKGAIENANRILRIYLPKKCSIQNRTQQDIENIVDQLNNRPMRCLDYRTPKEAFCEYRGALESSRAIRT